MCYKFVFSFFGQIDFSIFEKCFSPIEIFQYQKSISFDAEDLLLWFLIISENNIFPRIFIFTWGLRRRNNSKMKWLYTATRIQGSMSACCFYSNKLIEIEKWAHKIEKIFIFWKSLLFRNSKRPFRLNFRFRSRSRSTNKRFWSNRSNIHNTNRSLNCDLRLIHSVLLDCSACSKYFYTSGRFRRTLLKFKYPSRAN